MTSAKTQQYFRLFREFSIRDVIVSGDVSLVIALRTRYAGMKVIG